MTDHLPPKLTQQQANDALLACMCFVLAILIAAYLIFQDMGPPPMTRAQMEEAVTECISRDQNARMIFEAGEVVEIRCQEKGNKTDHTRGDAK